jgi:hypothetical protein
MRIGWTAAALVLLCGTAVAGPAGDKSGWRKCGGDETTWRVDLAIAPPPRLDCAGLKAVVKAFALLDERDLPNSQAGGRPKKMDYYPKTALGLLKSLRQGDGAAGPGCIALREAVAKTSDSSVALHAIELVTLIDNKAGTCTKGLRAALGDNPDALGVLGQAADLCETRKEPHCRELLAQAK